MTTKSSPILLIMRNSRFFTRILLFHSKPHSLSYRYATYSVPCRLTALAILGDRHLYPTIGFALCAVGFLVAGFFALAMIIAPCCPADSTFQVSPHTEAFYFYSVRSIERNFPFRARAPKMPRALGGRRCLLVEYYPTYSEPRLNNQP